MKPAAIAAVVATLAGVGVVFASPDNLVKNQIEGVIYQDVPGSLDQVCDTDPLASRIAIIEIHGLNQETKDPDGMSYASAEAHFSFLNNGWDTYFPVWYGLECESIFKRYVFRYNCNDDVYENARRLARHVEADPALSKGNVRIVLLGHSMGGLVSLDYRDYSSDRKYLGMLTLGTPYHGSELSDPSAVRQTFVDWYQAWLGNKLADKALKGIDFFTAGQQWLKPNSPKMQPVLKRVPLDSNCYLFAGTVPDPKMSISDKLWYTGALLDIMFLGKNSTQQIDVGYKLGAGLVYHISKEDNDGVVAVSSATAAGFNQQANVVTLPSNHSQLAKGAQGDIKIIRLTADALMAIYQSQFKPSGAPVSIAMSPPNPGLGDLKGFSGKVDLKSAQLVWVDGGRIFVSSGKNDSGTPVGMKATYEWPCWDGDDIIATSISGGRNIVRITERGESRLTTDGVSGFANVVDGRLVYVSYGKLVLVDNGPKILVGQGVEVDTPPLILDAQVYWAQKNGSVYAVYSTGLDNPIGLADQAKFVAGDLVSPPFELKGQLACLEPLRSGGQELVWLLPDWLKSPQLPSGTAGILSQDLFDSVSQIVLGGTGPYYLVADGAVRWVDPDQVPSGIGAVGLQLKALVAGEKYADVVRDGKEQLAPVLAPGIQLDAKP